MGHNRTRKPTLAELFGLLSQRGARVGFRAFDGSVIGSDSDTVGVVEIRSPRGLQYLATAPGELGLARAYVMGDVQIHGDLHATLRELLFSRRAALPWRQLLSAIRPWMLHRPPIPQEEAPSGWRREGRRHSRPRDARAICHHYDISNRFYALMLGRSMAYSCAVFTTPATTLEDAQREKFDLICRKLDLRPGQRLLDVGAGWGGLVRHAAAHYGVYALGVTLSHAQAEWAQRAALDAGLQQRAQVRLLDYRDLRERDFDAICSVGMMEHVGTTELGSYFRSLATRLHERGRMLNHAIARSSNCQRGHSSRFIDRYVFPDGELQSPGSVIAAMHDNGLEVRHEENLREHYAMTLREWGANLERHWQAAVAEVGERRARVWRLFMAMSRVGFETNSIQVHQVLGARVGVDGACDLPLRPEWEQARRQQRTAALV